MEITKTMKYILIKYYLAKIFKVLLPGFCQNKDLVAFRMTWTRRGQEQKNPRIL